MSISKCFCNLSDLPRRFIRPEIDSRSYCDGTHVSRLINGSEHYLVEFVWVSQQLIMVDLNHKWDLVSVLTSDRTKNAKSQCNGVAASLNGEFHNIFGIEVLWIGSKACSRRM